MSDLTATIRVGIVGAGYFGQFHYDAWSRMPEVQLAGVCVPDPASARATAERYGAPGAPLSVFADPAEMMRAARPAIVDITAPPAAHLEIIRALCDATLRMTEGELLSLQKLAQPGVTSEEYFDVIDRKTARLFSAACSIPSLMVPQRPREGAALAAYGRALGTCFQLVDDLLDFTAREDELGKPVLSDLKEGKLTLPLILLLPRLDARRRRLVTTVLEDRGFGRVSEAEILELVDSSGTVDEVRAMAEGYANQARNELAGLPPGEPLEALEFATDFVLRRRR